MSFAIDFPPVSFLQFWLTVAVLGMAIFFFGLYMLIFVWHFGKPLRKYLKARLAPGMGIIQEYVLENLYLHTAKLDNGIFTDTEDKKAEPVIGKSTVSINGVDTLLLWNVTPALPQRYTETLKSLVKLGYHNAEDIINDIESKLIGSSSELIEGSKLTYADFLALHKAVVEKYTVYVTPGDVLNFKENYLDEHPRKSVIEKEVTKEKKRLAEHKYEKYGFILIALIIVMGGSLIALKIYRGGA